MANTNGTVAVYNATTDTWVATVNLPSSSLPTALAVDATHGTLYVADASSHNRIEYLSTASCNATTVTGCSAVPSTVSVGQDPVALAIADARRPLRRQRGDRRRHLRRQPLTSHSLVTTISTSQPDNGTGLVESIAMSPSNGQVLAVLTGLAFPGDVMATIDPTTQAITATVGLQDGTDSMGELVGDSTRDYVWALDETKGATSFRT